MPHVVPTTRGILCTCYADLASATPSWRRSARRTATFYADEPFVRVMPGTVIPTLKSVCSSNLCDVGLAVDESAGKLIVISAIDNLVKGQAGVALQNVNLMLGLPGEDGARARAHVPVGAIARHGERGEGSASSPLSRCSATFLLRHSSGRWCRRWRGRCRTATGIRACRRRDWRAQDGSGC